MSRHRLDRNQLKTERQQRWLKWDSGVKLNLVYITKKKTLIEFLNKSQIQSISSCLQRLLLHAFDRLPRPQHGPIARQTIKMRSNLMEFKLGSAKRRERRRHKNLIKHGKKKIPTIDINRTAPLKMRAAWGRDDERERQRRNLTKAQILCVPSEGSTRARSMLSGWCYFQRERMRKWTKHETRERERPSVCCVICWVV